MEGCEWKQLSARLKLEYRFRSAALSIENGEKVLICFNTDFWAQNCEVFDGKSSVIKFEANYGHVAGGLAFYKGQPTTVGSLSDVFERGDTNKVETLSPSGWKILDDFPEKY